MGKKKTHKNCLTRIPYPAKLSFKNEGGMNSFSEEQRLRRFVASRWSLQETLKEAFQAERKWHQMLTQISKKKGRASEKVNIWINIKDCINTYACSFFPLILL